MDEVNRIVRGTRTPAIMPRVSSGAGVVGGRGHGRGAGGAQTDARGRGPGGRGQATAAAAAKARGKGSEADDGETPAAYDPLTGEPLEMGEDGGATSAAAAAASAMVSPKCEDKVDYDVMVDLVDHIMRTEGDGGSRGSEGGRGSGQSSSRGRNSRGGGGGGRGRDDRQRGGGAGSGSSEGWSRGGRGGGKQEAGGNSGEAEPLGAILIFLPGFAEIDQLVKALQRHARIGRGARVFPLHSSLPSNQQKSIFQRMPPGVRKIVVSTNIAETSVRSPDPTPAVAAMPFFVQFRLYASVSLPDTMSH